ncbi:MAG: hypothetical protein IPL61_13360 [Myxococcales bacterium]|nr:hypothetical protein [Myxococcales bacterium]
MVVPVYGRLSLPSNPMMVCPARVPLYASRPDALQYRPVIRSNAAPACPRHLELLPSAAPMYATCAPTGLNEISVARRSSGIVPRTFSSKLTSTGGGAGGGAGVDGVAGVDGGAAAVPAGSLFFLPHPGTAARSSARSGPMTFFKVSSWCDGPATVAPGSTPARARRPRGSRPALRRRAGRPRTARPGRPRALHRAQFGVARDAPSPAPPTRRAQQPQASYRSSAVLTPVAPPGPRSYGAGAVPARTGTPTSSRPVAIAPRREYTARGDGPE